MFRAKKVVLNHELLCYLEVPGSWNFLELEDPHNLMLSHLLLAL